METTFQVETHQIDLARIVEDVFSTMMHMDAVLSGPCAPATKSLTATVQFVGEWKGAVLLTCGAKLARAFAARLMPAPSGPEGAISKEDVSDTLGEVVNMIGGNLKSVLPPGVVLSIPSVIEGRDFALRICGGNEFKTNYYLCDDGPFEITLVRVVE
ncbi:MAG: chemotaxis protein CheX [Bryobacteraceae bacterium]